MVIRQRDLPFRLLLPRDLVLAIGHVITQWAHLEDQIDQEIIELSKLPACAVFDRRKLLRLNVEKRLQAWRNMVFTACSDPEVRATVDQIWKGAETAKPDRDAAAHAIWGTHGNRQIEFRQKRGESSSIKEKSHTDAIQEMEDSARRISFLNALHLRLMRRVEDLALSK